MSKKDIKCCLCQKQFSAVYNLRKHARKYHAEQVDLVIPKKSYNYQCPECHKNFSFLRNFNYHKKTHKNQSHSFDIPLTSKSTNTECPVCKLAASKENLIRHFEEEHDIKCETQTIEFTSFEEFTIWKTNMEHDTKTKYVIERGSQCNRDGIRIIKYCCHRSGKYVAGGKGARQLKSQGSKKIGGFCPARLKLTINKNNHHKVSFMSRHVGHDEDDLKHLFLTLEERKSLAKEVARKVPFTQILADIRDSAVGSQLERIHLLSRKDLSNIQRSFHLQTTVICHENDAVSVDSSEEQHESSDGSNLLISEDLHMAEASEIVPGLASSEISSRDVDGMQFAVGKQKLIDNFAWLMENVSCMEQLNAVKKAFISLERTLEAITAQQPPENISARLRSSSPSNKKTTPHRGKLHFTKKKKSKLAALVVPQQMRELQEISIKLLTN